MQNNLENENENEKDKSHNNTLNIENKDINNLSSVLNTNQTNQSQQQTRSQQQKKRSKSIGHYILGKTLGEGTFGKVKLATHILTGEKVAIKILEKERIIDVSDVERVSREIHILKLLRHVNIIQLYEIIETPKQLFLVMEYANGGELFDYIVANTKVKDREACKFFQQIINGIEYIHKLNIVHRDMKPENLLLSNSKQIKIVDFGLSNTYKKSELLKTACGSPCYAAPEMIAGKRYQGLNVDIWSCGVILYALLCGYLPFEDPNTANLYKKILAGDYTIPKFVSAEAKDLIKNILNTDPQKRYTISDIRKHPWYQLSKPHYIPEGIIVGYNKIPIDFEILKQLESFGFNIDYSQKCIEANKHNHVTTTYYLILKKHLSNGGKSKADISSDNFDATLILPNKRPIKNLPEANLNSNENMEISTSNNINNITEGAFPGEKPDKEKINGKFSNSRRESKQQGNKQEQYFNLNNKNGSTGGSSSRDQELNFNVNSNNTNINTTQTQNFNISTINNTVLTQEGTSNLDTEIKTSTKTTIGPPTNNSYNSNNKNQLTQLQQQQLPYILNQTNYKKSNKGQIQTNQLNFSVNDSKQPVSNKPNNYFYETSQNQSPSPNKYNALTTQNTTNDQINLKNDQQIIPQSLLSNQSQQQHQQHQQQQQLLVYNANMKYPTVPNSSVQSPKNDNRFSNRRKIKVLEKSHVVPQNPQNESYVSSSEQSRHSSLGHNGLPVGNYGNRIRITTYHHQQQQQAQFQQQQIQSIQQQQLQQQKIQLQHKQNNSILNKSKQNYGGGMRMQQNQQQINQQDTRQGKYINAIGVQYERERGKSTDPYQTFILNNTLNTTNHNQNKNIINSNNISFDVQTSHQHKRGKSNPLQNILGTNNLDKNTVGLNQFSEALNNSVNLNTTSYNQYGRKKNY